ncbi:tyrosine-type recombinase/integrase [Bacillus sp. N3536]|nr:tyrosine-type recombinase/integrase [Bacillus sp. N3536]
MRSIISVILKENKATMPIRKVEQSPINKARSELQAILGNYGPEILENIISEMGITKEVLKTDINESVTLIAAIEYYRTSSAFLGLSNSSKKTYSSEVEQFKSFVTREIGSNITLQNATEPILLVKYLKSFKSPNTKAKKSAFLRSFFRCVLSYFLKKDISQIKDVLKVNWTSDNLPRAFTQVQLAEIIDLCKLFNNELRNYTILWTFLGTGIRLSELINLQILDIDKESQTIKVIPKGNEEIKKARKISSIALLILLDYINFKYAHFSKIKSEVEYKQLYIFSTNNGQSPINKRTIQHLMNKLIVNASSIPQNEKSRYNVHTLRHCFAVYGLDAGIDIYTLSKLLGHESIKSTTVYLKLFDNQLLEAIEKHPFANEEKMKIQKRIINEL